MVDVFLVIGAVGAVTCLVIGFVLSVVIVVRLRKLDRLIERLIAGNR